MQDRINQLQTRIAAYEKKYHRDTRSVQLLAASKGQSIEKIRDAIQCGQRIFGENYLQEALEKIQALAHENLEWHFIGPIQSNKTKKIAEHFSWVQSIDDIRIAKRLNDQRPDTLPPLNICIEINIGHEATKSGVTASQLLTFAHACAQLPRLKLRGLMAIPTPTTDIKIQRHQFHALYLLWETLRQQHIALDTLSMGMSDDFEAAIAEGSTMVRIGTALFGPRL